MGCTLSAASGLSLAVAILSLQQKAVIASLNKYELLRWGFYLHAHLCLSLRLCLLCWSPPSCPATFRLDLKSSKHLRKKCCISHLICLCLTFCLAKVKRSKKLWMQRKDLVLFGSLLCCLIHSSNERRNLWWTDLSVCSTFTNFL